MADPFIGEIRMFAASFAPLNWAFCDGQTINIEQNPALFSLFGTIYGGDGRNDFGVPNLQDRVPVGDGQGTGLTNRPIGQVGGPIPILSPRYRVIPTT
ncbi:phage tail protein [Candidatus Entotheonella palauensis]|uniref:phage tail protein n=1 Tax=Candidatus Entotheonella palauensis TaxID=93172 RepID=UPI000B7E0810|nr:tail fiber protein [Candidatus Entotheonella palauensis]